MTKVAAKAPFNSTSLADANSISDLKQRIEITLESYFLYRLGIDKDTLMSDPYYEPGLFRQLLPWSPKNAIVFFKNQLQIDLTENPIFSKIQEIILAPDDGKMCSCWKTHLKNEIYLGQYFFELLP